MDIRLNSKDKKRASNPEDVYDIMQRILLRENRIDREKKHFWIVGLNIAGYILYIELVSLGSVKRRVIEPMNVYRLAVMKNATQIIGIHNHPSGNLTPSEEDKDTTDRLIQVGKILGIAFADHMIITPTTYVSFKTMGLMKKLEQSLKYVPTYQVIEKITYEKEFLKREMEAVRKEKDEGFLGSIRFMKEKGLTPKQMATVLSIELKEVNRLLKKT